MFRQIVFLTLVIGAFGGGFNNRPGFGNSGFGDAGFGNSGFGNSGFGNTGFQTGTNFDNSRIQVQKKAEGSAAGAGNAAVGGVGDAESVNTADHQAGDGKTQSKGQSLNKASGTGGVTAGGAAQAGGNAASQKQGEKQSGFQTQNIQVPNNFGGSNFGGSRPHGHGNNMGGGFVPNTGFTGGNRGNGGAPFGGSSSGNQGSNFNKGSQSGGTAAGAGTASVVDGTAQSNNNAEQFADEHGDRESGSSLNRASGINPNTQGAAQAGGNNAQQNAASRFANQNHNQRF